MAKKLKPTDADFGRKTENPFKVIRSIRGVAVFRQIPWPTNTIELAANNFIRYASVVQPILSTTLREFDEPGGALNAHSARRRPSAVAIRLTSTEQEQLLELRELIQSHLNAHFHALARPPPLAGGDTARWSIAMIMWTLVCLLSCVLRRFGFGTNRILEYRPCEQAYLCAQLLVIDTAPAMSYSLRALQMTVQNLLERLCAITEYSEHLDRFVAILEHRTAELVCGSGSPATYAAEWSSPIAYAHTGSQKAEHRPGEEKLLACTTDFVQQSMIWFVTINNQLAAYHLVAAPPREGSYTGEWERASVEQARALDWFPTDAMLYRALEFYCEYAKTCVDDTYAHMQRDYCMQFEGSPEQATYYRVTHGVDTAPTSEVMSQKMPNISPVGREFVRLIKYSMPMLEWLHRFWNWRKGETRIRSGYLGANRFYTQLAILYIVDLYISNRRRTPFRHRFVIYHNNPAFSFLCQKGKRSGMPFIVQQFGWWSVFVPHRTDPRLGMPVEAPDVDSDSSESPFGDVEDARVAHEADQRGDSLSLHSARMATSRIPNELPNDAFCRVYDCETFLEAWSVWALALLRVKGGVVDNVELGPFICDLFGLPRGKEAD